jgi:hypothetical protein
MDGSLNVVRFTQPPYGTSMPQSGAVHSIICRHKRAHHGCPLCRQKRTCSSSTSMSATCKSRRRANLGDVPRNTWRGAVHALGGSAVPTQLRVNLSVVFGRISEKTSARSQVLRDQISGVQDPRHPFRDPGDPKVRHSLIGPSWT